MAVKLLPLPQVQAITDDCKAQTYDLISDGLFPPPVKVGRKSVFPDHEVNAIVAARIAGVSDDELRELVKRLVAQRKARFEALLAREVAIDGPLGPGKEAA